MDASKIIKYQNSGAPVEKTFCKANGRLFPTVGMEAVRKYDVLETQKERTRSIAESIKKLLALEDVRMDYYVDEESGIITIKLIEKASGKVVRKIPTGMQRSSSIIDLIT